MHHSQEPGLVLCRNVVRIRKPLTVLVLSDQGFSKGGGAELYSKVLCEGLKKAGVTPVTASISSDDASVRLNRRSGISSRLYDFSLISSLESVIKEFSVDIIHANILHQPHALAFMMAARKLKVPYVTTVFSYAHVCPTEYYLRLPERVPCNTPYFNTHCVRCIAAKRLMDAHLSSAMISYLRAPYSIHVFRTFLRRAAAVVSPSKHYSQTLRKLGIYSHYLPYPVEFENFKPVLSNNGNILFVGRLVWEKGVSLLPTIARAFPNRTIHVVGDGRMYDWLKKRSPANIVMHGYVPNWWKYHSKQDLVECSVIIVPSLWSEMFCYVVSEAFMLTKPVVSFNLGGPKEQIEQSKGGLLAEPFDLQDFIRKTCYLLENTEKARDMGLNGRLWALKALNPKKHVRNILALYYKLLEKRGS